MPGLQAPMPEGAACFNQLGFGRCWWGMRLQFF